jgi:hypothetical protein
MAGASSDQKLAAIMTPEANPSMTFRTLWLISLKKNTNAAPRAVMAQVPSVARKARNTGFCMSSFISETYALTFLVSCQY